MESSLTESIQQLVRPGKCVDLYYPDPETATKACFRTTVNTKYIQAWTNLSAGVNTLTISPNNGVGDVICVLQLPAISANFAQLGLPAGWGYSLIKQLTFRYGGSPQYALTGQQVLQAVLSQATDSGSRDALMTLGGVALSGTNGTGGNDFSNANYAYLYLPLPHSVPSVEGKPPPFPSDLLTQQIQIQVEMYPLTSIFSVGTGSSLAGIPSALTSAEFQVQQIAFSNQADALARRVDMTSNSLTYPVRFIQQESPITLVSPSVGPNATQNVTLTGFRSGEVREMHCWLQASSDIPTGGTAGSIVNPFKWFAIENVTVSYSGDQYARADFGSQQLWSLVNGRVPTQVNSTILTQNGSSDIVDTTTFAPAWTVLPFGQSYAGPTAHSTYMAGLPITNGIVNLQFTIPANAPTSTNYTLHVSYIYNAVLALSQGTADYIF